MFTMKFIKNFNVKVRKNKKVKPRLTVGYPTVRHAHRRANFISYAHAIFKSHA